LVLVFLRQTWIKIDLGKFVDQIREYKRVRIIGIEKHAALLGEIGFIRFFVDGEEKFLLEREQLFFARVLVKRELGFIDGPALVWVFHHAQELFIARLTEFYFEHETSTGLHIALLKFFDGLAGHSVAKHVLLPHQLLDERFPFVVLVRGNSRWSADD